MQLIIAHLIIKIVQNTLYFTFIKRYAIMIKTAIFGDRELSNKRLITTLGPVRTIETLFSIRYVPLRTTIAVESGVSSRTRRARVSTEYRRTGSSVLTRVTRACVIIYIRSIIHCIVLFNESSVNTVGLYPCFQ